MSDIPALISELRQLAELLGQRQAEYVDHHTVTPADPQAIDAASCMDEAAKALENLDHRLDGVRQQLLVEEIKYQSAQARIAALEAALEPFRKAAEVLMPIGNVDPMDVSIWSFSGGRDEANVRITFADMYAVLAVLEKAE